MNIARILFVSAAAALLLCSCSGEAGEQDYPEVRIACIGDSITWGSRLEDRFSQSYPAVLGDLLGEGFEVRGFGYSARTASLKGDHPYFEAAKYDTLKMWLPDVVTIMLGTNDSKVRNWDPEQYHEGLRTIIDDLRKVPSHPRIVLLTPTPAGDNPYTIRDSVIRSEVIPELQKVAARRWLDVIDLYTPMLAHRDLFPDNVHPGAEGSALIASLVRDALVGMGVRPGPRVMFVGDSITDGAWGLKDSRPASERSHYDLNHLYGHGYAFCAIGRLMLDSPGLGIRCYNRGWGGNSLSDIRARWSEEVLSVRPSLISLLVGVNDVSAGSRRVDVQAWEASYRALIDSTLEVLPGVKFVLCTPFVRNASGFYPDRDDAAVDELAQAVRRIAADYGFPLADFASVVYSLCDSDAAPDRHYWLWDGIHPTCATHVRLAGEWIDVVYKNNLI